MTPEERRVHLESFDYVWKTIRDKHWDPKPSGLDWQAVYNELRPKAEEAGSAAEIRASMDSMLNRLKMSHFKVLSMDLANVDWSSLGDGEPGFELRLVDGFATVSRAEPGVAAKTGWRVHRVRGKDLAPPIAALRKEFQGAQEGDLRMSAMLNSRLSGIPGAELPVEFEDGAGRRFEVKLPLREPRGKSSAFGNLPPQAVFFEYRRLNPALGYIRFNLFLDPARIVKQFGEAVIDCANCAGLIVDVRGNPGGIGIMAAGIAGWLVQESGLRLGTMQLRDSKLNFTVNARPQSFRGKVAILVDGASASTAEIFAGGLQDLKRASVFGTRSAAAALPSMIERLPNGDFFQYAISNYVSESGKTLEETGVVPDVEVKLTRAALLAGRDPVVDAAAKWITGGSK